MAQRFYIDTYSQAIWSRPTRSPVTRFRFQRGSTEQIEVRFVTDGVVGPLADSGAVVTLSFKTAPTDASFLVSAVTATVTGSGTNAKYVLSPTFSSSALDTLLGTDESAQVYGELKWTDGSTINSTQFLARIEQNLNRGGETNPGVVSSGTPQALASITSFTGTSSTSLPYVPTVGLSADTNVPFLIRIGGQFIPVYLESGAADGTDPGQVAPLDYNVSTNNKHWTRGG